MPQRLLYLENKPYISKKNKFKNRVTIMTNMDNYCVIMGGGIGSRFWPFSRKTLPKQFLDFFGTGVHSCNRPSTASKR